jgi:NADH-quinone oxidoreductase subunit F
MTAIRNLTIEDIEKADIRDFGMYTDSLAEKIKEYNADGNGDDAAIVAALNNFDGSFELLKALKDKCESICAGIEKIAELIKAKKRFVYLPEGCETFAKCLEKYAGKDLTIEYGIVPVREHRKSLILHLETARKAGDLALGNDYDNTPVKIEEIGGEIKTVFEMAYVPYGKKLSQLADVDKEQVKFVKAAGRLKDADYLDTVIEKDMPLGDGVIRIYDTTCCIVDQVQKDVKANRSRSCGKCTFCREGLTQQDMRLDEIEDKAGVLRALDVMKKIGESMVYSTQCSIGEFSGLEAADSIDMFRDEYEAHIKKKYCPTGACKSFIRMYVDPRKCDGCMVCLKACPDNCIEGMEGYIHIIEDDYCSKCDRCIEVCPQNAIVKTIEKAPALPDRMTKVGRFKRY